MFQKWPICFKKNNCVLTWTCSSGRSTSAIPGGNLFNERLTCKLKSGLGQSKSITDFELFHPCVTDISMESNYLQKCWLKLGTPNMVLKVCTLIEILLSNILSTTVLWSCNNFNIIDSTFTQMLPPNVTNPKDNIPQKNLPKYSILPNVILYHPSCGCPVQINRNESFTRIISNSSLFVCK